MPMYRYKDVTAVVANSDKQKQLLNNDPFTRGLLSLPIESLLDILSYFPTIDLPRPPGSNISLTQYDPSIPSCCCTRSNVLRTLSQTCRALRNRFLPMLWERLEVYTREGEGVWYKRVSRILETRSQGLADNKELAAYVRSVHVVLTRCSTGTVIPAFARCLAALPNLHTIEILHAHSKMTTALKDGFEDHSFPSVRTLIIPSCAHNILRCCPEARTVICTEDDGSTIVGAIATACKKVEVIEGLCPDVAMMKRIVKVAPNLRSLKAYAAPVTSSALHVLSPLKKLTTLEFAVEKATSDVDDCIAVARTILRGVESGVERKHLKVYYCEPIRRSKKFLMISEENVLVE